MHTEVQLAYSLSKFKQHKLESLIRFWIRFYEIFFAMTPRYNARSCFISLLIFHNQWFCAQTISSEKNRVILRLYNNSRLFSYLSIFNFDDFTYE